MSAGEFGRAANPMVTRSEMLARLRARVRPRPMLELTPGGWQRREVVQSLDAENERRIGEIRARLERARAEVRSDHSKALQRGRARQSFERSR